VGTENGMGGKKWKKVPFNLFYLPLQTFLLVDLGPSKFPLFHPISLFCFPYSDIIGFFSTRKYSLVKKIHQRYKSIRV
jgi:hypothetical protein